MNAQGLPEAEYEPHFVSVLTVGIVDAFWVLFFCFKGGAVQGLASCLLSPPYLVAGPCRRQPFLYRNDLPPLST